MSHLSVLGLTPGKPYEVILDLGNSFLGPPALWDWLGKRYVSPANEWHRAEHLQRVFDLEIDASVPLAHRRVLSMTIRRSVVREGDYPAAAADLLGMPPEAGAHWHAIGRFLAEGGAAGYPMVGLLASQDETPFPDIVEGEDGEEVLREFDWSTVYDVFGRVR